MALSHARGSANPVAGEPGRMERRRFLRDAALASVCATGLGLAGCVAPPASASGGDCPGSAPPPSGATGGPTAPPEPPTDLPVDRDALARGALRDEIPAITDPAFGPDWADVAGTLTDEDLVIGVERDGRARAYPLATLSAYEVVNDEFAGHLLVTYCPLCASGVTAVRRVRGEPTVFGVSGLLYHGNLVLYDRRTDSLWSQVLARAIRGPATGDALELVPSAVTTWAAWRDAHPGTRVLLPPPASGTIAADPSTYGVHGHVGVQSVGQAVSDDRLHRRTLVLGVATETAATAYPQQVVAVAGPINDCVGGLPVLVAGEQIPQAFDRRVDGTALSFRAAGSGRVRGGGSTWSLTTGRALDGPHAGRSLRRLRGATATYWFAWVAVRPETSVYRG